MLTISLYITTSEMTGLRVTVHRSTAGLLTWSLLWHVQILVVMGLLMRIIHVVPALAGLSVTIVLVPITTVVSRRLSKVRRALIKCTDDRVKLVTEVITGSSLSLCLAVYAIYCLCIHACTCP